MDTMRDKCRALIVTDAMRNGYRADAVAKYV
jgi:hypothetical protein